MGQALNHGVPVVSYDYLYGPREMVISGKNGEIIPLNNQGQFIQTVVKLLQDRDELQSLSTGAYDNLDELVRSEEHTSELQSRFELVCRLLLEKKKQSSI